MSSQRDATWQMKKSDSVNISHLRIAPTILKWSYMLMLFKKKKDLLKCIDKL